MRDGDSYVINGHKWWTSGIGDKRCKVLIFMGKTDPKNPDRYKQQSMIVVPRETPGIKVVRMLTVFGYDDAPRPRRGAVRERAGAGRQHAARRGRGFEIAQGRLGPGRIHHCMRQIGVAERALEYMCKRSLNRVAFGKRLAENDITTERIAQSRIEIDQARLLVLHAAYMMDTVGNKAAKQAIAEIKVAVPNMTLGVLDRAMQLHGGGGVSQEFPLAFWWAHSRTLRFADGPDEVHRRQIGRLELRKHSLGRPDDAQDDRRRSARQQLQREGVRVVFGLPGVQLYGAMARAARREGHPVHPDSPRAGHDVHGRRLRAGRRRRRRRAGGAGAGRAERRRRAQHGVLRARRRCSWWPGRCRRRYLGKDVGVLHEVNEQLDVRRADHQVAQAACWRSQRSRRPSTRRSASSRPAGRARCVSRSRPTRWRKRARRAAAAAVTVARTAAPDADIERAARAARRHAPDHLRRRRRARLRRPRGADARWPSTSGRRRAVRRGQGLGERSRAISPSARRSGPRTRCASHLDAADVDLRRRLALRGGRLPAQPEDRPARRGRRGDRPQSSGGASASSGDARPTLERLLERLRTDAPPKPSRRREREQLREAVAALDTQEPNHSILASLRAGTPRTPSSSPA